MNLATGITLGVIIVILTAIVINEIRKRKNGKHSCSCGCSCDACGLKCGSKNSDTLEK